MRILGVDPGLRLTGYGVVDYQLLRPRLVDGGVIRLTAKAAIAQRLVELETRTAILMGHARGVILLVAARRGVRVEQYAANRIKQAVAGHGHASKVQMQRTIQAIWNLPEPPRPPDVADALAIALCCGRHIGARRTAVPGV